MSPSNAQFQRALALLLLGGDMMAGPATWSLAEVRKRLEALSRPEAQASEKKAVPGSRRRAMCYKPRIVRPPQEPERVEYLCPACGHRTVYTRRPEFMTLFNLNALVAALPAHRAQAKAIPNLDVSLDESGLCSHCSPDAKEVRAVLVVKLKDRTSTRTPNWSKDDLSLLAEFAAGARKHGGTQPMGENAPRLKQLLGVN